MSDGFSVLIEDDRWQESLGGHGEEICRAAAQAALLPYREKNRGAHKGAICVVLGDDELLQRLNREYRGLDKPTNVLSFNSGDDDLENGEPIIGDIAVSYETCLRESGEQSKSLRDHLSHLVVHGTLHLLGHDHETEIGAGEMEALEIEILSKLKITNPYN